MMAKEIQRIHATIILRLETNQMMTHQAFNEINAQANLHLNNVSLDRKKWLEQNTICKHLNLRCVNCCMLHVTKPVFSSIVLHKLSM